MQLLYRKSSIKPPPGGEGFFISHKSEVEGGKGRLIETAAYLRGGLI